ncbi:MAG TPA: homoserine dehydrogenase, partial [Chitinophagaceae bacterium]|nr:homoserine dehydrogenase [Chitinophagaceae bacterium]
MEQKLVIGLFGFGTVGEGIYHILQQTPSLQAEIKKICIRNAAKTRSVDAHYFTTNYDVLLADPEINLIVELIDDAGEALKIVTTALQRGKAVVSANKKMIAENGPQLLRLQQEYNGSFLYEASVCGSIPILRNLEEYYDNDFLKSVCGIVNGSTNFILTKMDEDGLDYSKALQLAQQAGFAESNPALDVKGIDAVNKLAILLLHAYGIVTHPQQLLHLGIDHLHPYDAKRASEKGLKIKLTAQAVKLANGAVAAFVLPQYVQPESQLYGVRNEFNAVVLQTTFADKQFLYGKGAGRYPTASAVLSDVSALRYNYRYEYRKWNGETNLALTEDFYLRVYVSFEVWNDVELKDFEWIEEFFSNEARQYLVGVIQFAKLKNAVWLRKAA